MKKHMPIIFLIVLLLSSVSPCVLNTVAQERQHIPRKDYAEAYKETYSPDQFPRRYRENYRVNPIYTGGVDPYIRYRFLNHYDYYRLPYYHNRYYPPFENSSNEITGPRVVIDRNPRPLGVPNIPRSPSFDLPTFTIDYQTFLRPAALDPNLLAYFEEQQKETEGHQADKIDQAMIPDEPAPNETKPQVVQNARLRSPLELAYDNTVELLQKGRFHQGIEYLETMLQQDPENQKFKDTLLVANFLKGEFKNAVSLIDNSHELEALDWLHDLPQYRFQSKRLQSMLAQSPNDESLSQLAEYLAIK